MRAPARGLLAILAAGLSLALAPAPARASAQITIVNSDGAGEGFNDPTPATPVGGNTGTTVGQQRLHARALDAERLGHEGDQEEAEQHGDRVAEPAREHQVAPGRVSPKVKFQRFLCMSMHERRLWC